MLKLDRLVSEAGLERVQLHLALLDDFVSVLQVLKPLDMRLLLRPAGLRAAHHPFEVLAVERGHLSLGGLRVIEALGLHVQIDGKSALVAVCAASVELDGLVRHPVEKIPVVRDHEEGGAHPCEVIFQPLDHAAVQVVRRLIENEKVARREEGCDERGPLLLSAGERVGRRVRVRNAEVDEPRPGLTGRVPVVRLSVNFLLDIVEN